MVSEISYSPAAVNARVCGVVDARAELRHVAIIAISRRAGARPIVANRSIGDAAA